MHARARNFQTEFIGFDAVLLEFAYDEWQKPWLLPQYRPLLPRILESHSGHDGGDAFVELVDRELAKLALEKPPEQPKKIAAVRTRSPMKKSKRRDE
jgi:hypothetical protein